MKDRNNYSIQSPIGVFKNINDAVEVYPYLTEHNRITQCQYCQRYFIKYGKEDNPRVYCNEECSRKAKSIQVNNYYYDKIFVKREPFRTDHYTQILKDTDNRRMDKVNPIEYIQDDNYWGLGTGNLTGTPANNFKREHKYIRNELKRLGIK